MKFELKTENENYSKSFSQLIKSVFILGLIIIFCDAAIKLGIISRQYQIDFSCKLLAVEKSKSNFKKLSKLSKLKSNKKFGTFVRTLLNNI